MRILARRSTVLATFAAGLAAVLPSVSSADARTAAAPGQEVLILQSTVSGGTSSIEAQEVVSLGLTPILVDEATWSGMTAADFAGYRGLILGDATCAEAAPIAVEQNVDEWGEAVRGNVIVVGTDPVYHSDEGGAELTRAAVDFALADAARTGMYVSLSCYYHDAAEHTNVPLLDGLRPDGFTVRGVGCYDDAHIVASHPATDLLTDATLSGWSCSVHEAFDTWPADYTVLAMARDIGASYTAPDGSVGTPYILARGRQLRSFPMSVNHSSETNDVSGQASYLVTLLDKDTSAPAPDVELAGKVVSGPQAGTRLTCSVPCTTDLNGQQLFTLNGEDSGSDSIVLWVDDDSDGIPDVGEAQVSALARWRSKYIALGDSYSSGEGNAPYLEGTNTDANHCHRSYRAYAESLTLAIPAATTLSFAACSGATTADLVGRNRDNRGEEPQLDRIKAGQSLVTLTIGGNDVGFAQILESCIYTKNVIVGPFVPGNKGCNEREDVWGPTYERINAFVRERDTAAPDGRKIQHLSDILAKIAKKAKKAEIYVAGYPLLFEQVESTKSKSCVVGTAKFGAKMRLRYDDIAWMNQTTALLNRQVRRVVQEASSRGIRAHYVNVSTAFADKGLCGDHESWIYGLLMKADKKHPKADSFHPTARGQAAYKEAFQAAGATTS